MNVLMIFPGMLDDLPPLITSSICMAELGCHINVVGLGSSDETKKQLDRNGISINLVGYRNYPCTLAGRIRIRIEFASLLKIVIGKSNPQVIWYHGGHAAEYRHLIPEQSQKITIVHAHEVYENTKWLRKRQNSVLRECHFFIVPNIHRGWILKAISGTGAPFIVVPNRWRDDMVPSDLDKNYATLEFRRMGGGINCRKIIIYQGLIASDRCIKEILSGFNSTNREDVGLLLVGNCPDLYYWRQLSKIIENDNRIVAIPKIPPPFHLRITAGCLAGILSYAPTCLNNVYAAPNKIFEYALLGLGMILPNYPEFSWLNEKFEFGEIYEPMNVDSIANSIERITAGDRSFRDSALSYLKSIPKPEEVYTEIHGKIQRLLY